MPGPAKNPDVVHCFFCDDFEPYVHPVQVTVNRGGVITTIDADGESINPDGEAAARGVLISITYHCECGAKFAVHHHFHKGHTYIRREVIEAPEEEDGPARELLMLPTIWRN
jgi:hypothetical protein